jgi:outer membrane protein OmpA-like peptidoglycan-associated protein
MRLLTALLGFVLLPGAALAQQMELRVVLWAPLNTKTSHKGDRVVARVAQPDALKGDEVRGTVTDARSRGGGRPSVLNISFESLQHGGQTVALGAQIRAFQNSKGHAGVDEEGKAARNGNGNEIVGDASDIRFDAGSSFTLSLQPGSVAALSALLAPPSAPAMPGSSVHWASETLPPTPAPVAAPPTPAPAPAPVAPPTPAPPPAPPVAAAPVPPAPPPAPPAPAATPQPDFTALKDDFIPGEKVLLYDDFTDMSPDEAPPHWKVRGSAPVLMAAGGVRQLSIGYRTHMTPSIPNIPKNFTVETEFSYDPKEGGEMTWLFYPDKSDNEVLKLELATRGDDVRLIANTNKEGLLDNEFPYDRSHPMKHAIWVQNGRVRTYIDGRKVLDVNQVELPNLDHAILVSNFMGGKINYRSIRIAESTPDFSRSIASAGKYVTHGILFDTNSDRIKPESAAIIKSIGFGLQTNADLKLKIEGHTDSSGQAAANLDLSKRRAEAVKQVLVAQFQIDAARLTTDGLGATKPVDTNDTPQGRAQNRRVEFIKQ